MSVKIQGWDLALNHAAFVEIIDGKLSNFWFVSKIQKHKNKLDAHCYFLDYPKKLGRSLEDMVRYDQWCDILDVHVAHTKPDYVCIEDYAFGAKGSLTQIAGVGEKARHSLYKSLIPYRLYSPKSAKKFTAHHGSADKDMMLAAVKKRWDTDFSKYEKLLNKEISEDLADAFGLAQIFYTELQIRLGHVLLKELDVKEIEVFNQVSKRLPDNVLVRDMIYNTTLGGEMEWKL